MAVVQKPNKRRRPSTTPPKVKRGKSPKKVASNTKNPEKYLRRKRATMDSVYDSSESQSSVFEQAKEVQANLSHKFPSLIKLMLPSHVTGGFWLGLPKKFCQLHMPKADTIIALEDESGKEYETKYLVEKMGLSGGWRGFSLAHNLFQGDALVFHLVQPSKFKVYIIRCHGSNEVDVALSLLKLDGCMKQKDFDVLQENDPNSSSMICGTIVSQSDQPENTSEDFGSEVLGGIRLSESIITFQEVTGIENFRILVNGLVIDSELSNYLRTKYFELCCSQRLFLHDHLLEGLNCKLVAGIISETINIADAIRASKITTSPDSFAVWEKTLKAFEAMGMNIRFLLTRLYQLMSLASKSQRYKEARLERDLAEEEMKILEAKLVEVKETMNRLDVEMNSQDLSSHRLEVMFQVLANAPW